MYAPSNTPLGYGRDSASPCFVTMFVAIPRPRRRPRDYSQDGKSDSPARIAGDDRDHGQNHRPDSAISRPDLPLHVLAQTFSLMLFHDADRNRVIGISVVFRRAAASLGRTISLRIRPETLRISSVKNVAALIDRGVG